MKKTIDLLDTAGTWVCSSGATAQYYGLNDVKPYIAGGLSHSTILHWDSGASGKSLTKTLAAINTTGHRELVISAHSVRLGPSGDGYRSFSDYSYKIAFNGTMTPFYLPISSTMTDFTFDITGITSIDRITVTSLTDSEDYLVLSYCLVCTDELPLDIFISAKTEMEAIRDELYGSGFLVGTVTAAAGDSEITIGSNGNPWIDRYAVIMITGGGKTEYHQLADNNERVFRFTHLYGGKTLTNSFTAGSVYLIFPVEYGKRQSEIILPGISIYGQSPEPKMLGGKVERVNDTYKTTKTIAERQDYQITSWEITVDCEARQDQILAELSKIVRYFIARMQMWVNGKRFEVKTVGKPQFIEAMESVNDIPKLQYTFLVETKEDIWPRETLVNTTTLNQVTTIQDRPSGT